MNEPATADHLRKLSKQLVTAAEKRAELKAELADLKRAAKSSQITAKQRKVQQQIQRLSRRLESLIAAIADPVPRRVERWAGVMPVTLVVESHGRKYEHIASTVDGSETGLRIRTNTALTPGQTLEIYSDGGHVGFCRVVWVSPAGSVRPCEVGLEILR